MTDPDGLLPTDFDAAETESPVRAMQNASLERALLSPTDSADHVALAGALERTRSDDEDQLSLSSATMLACLLSLRLSELSSADFGLTAVAGHRPNDDPLLVGALVALDRFELSIPTAASLANRSVDDFRAELERRRKQ